MPHTAQVDVIVYATPFGKVANKRLMQKEQLSTRRYHADAHNMSAYLEREAYDLVIVNSVFEHLRDPFTAMREARRVLILILIGILILTLSTYESPSPQ